MSVKNIINGGIYLVDLTGYVSPEFGFNHYCILLKTSKKDLYLAFPITTSEKRKNDKYTIPNFVDGEGYILLHQVKPISKTRIISAKKKNGMMVCISEEQSNRLFDEYIQYITDLKQNNSLSIKKIMENREDSKQNMILNCLEDYHVVQGDILDYNSLIIEATGGKLTHTDISTKKVGEYVVQFYLTDIYGFKIKKETKIYIDPIGSATDKNI